MEKSELRAVIKYSNLKKLPPKKMYDDMVNTLGDSAPSYTMVKKWEAEFKRGRQSIEDDPRSGRPSTSSSDEIVQKARDLVNEDRRIKIRYISETLGISYGRAQSSLKDKLGLNQLSARWVPRMLTQEMKDTRVRHSRSLLIRMQSNRESLDLRFVTEDESSVH